MKRTLLLTSLLLAAGATFGVAHAADCGFGGSEPNGSGSCETAGNDVRCGDGIDTGLVVLSANAEGAEVCNDGDSAFPLQGRAGAQQDCECIYIDGDDDNSHDLLLNGWLRIDRTGVYCAERLSSGGQSYTGPGQPVQGCFD